MFRLLPRFAAILLIATIVDASAQTPSDLPRERLGVRASATGTMSDLNDHFGNGYDFTLYFTERMWQGLSLDVRIGATYFGDLVPAEIAIEFLKRFPQVIIVDEEAVTSEMRLAYLSLGPHYVWRMNDTQNLYATMGLGIYSVSMLFDTGIQALNLSDQHFGGSAGGGFLWRITDNWNIELNATAQGIWTGKDKDTLYYYFTSKGRNPVIFNFGLGLAIDLR